MGESLFKKVEGEDRPEAAGRSEKGGKSARKAAIERELAKRASPEGGKGPEDAKRKEEISRVLGEEEIKVLVRDVLDAASAEEALETLRIYGGMDIRVTPEILQKVALERISAAKTEEEREETRQVFVNAGIIPAEIKGEVVDSEKEPVGSGGGEVPINLPAVEEKQEVSGGSPPPTEEEIRLYQETFEKAARWLERGLHPAPSDVAVGAAEEPEGEEAIFAPEAEPERSMEERVSEALSLEEPPEIKAMRSALFDAAYELYGKKIDTLNEVVKAENAAGALAEAFLKRELNADDQELMELLNMEDPRPSITEYALKKYEKWEEIAEIGIESDSPREVLIEKIRQGSIPEKEGRYILNEMTARALEEIIRFVAEGQIKGPLTLYWEEIMFERQAARARMTEQAEAAVRFYKDEGRRGRKKKLQPGEEIGQDRRAKFSRRAVDKKIAKSLQETAEKEVEEIAARAFLEELRRDPQKMKEFEENQPRGRVEEIKYQISLIEAEERWKKDIEERREGIIGRRDDKKIEIEELWYPEGLQAELQELMARPIGEFAIPPSTRSKLQKLNLLQQEYQTLVREMNSLENIPLEKPRRTVLKGEARPSRFQGARLTAPREKGGAEEEGLRKNQLALIAGVKEELERTTGEQLSKITAKDFEKVGTVLRDLDFLKARVNKNPLPQALLERDLKFIRRRARIVLGLVSEEELAKGFEELKKKGILTTAAEIETRGAASALKESKKKKKEKEESAEGGRKVKGRSKQ